jgi:hypothetical protein
MGEQALIIRLHNLGERADDIGMEALDALLALQQQLTSAVEGAGVGEVDGNEIALDDSEGSLWVYGPDAKAMLKAALSVVCHSPLAPEQSCTTATTAMRWRGKRASYLPTCVPITTVEFML